MSKNKSKKTKKDKRDYTSGPRRKKIIVIFSVLVLIIGFFIWFMVTPKEDLPRFLQKFKIERGSVASEYNPQPTTILYYTPDWSENIFDDEDYVELLGPYSIEYKKNNFSIKFEDDPERIEQYSPYAKFMYDFIETAKHGDYETYNSYFFDEYFSTHERKGSFTMQKIYDLHVTEFDSIETALEEYPVVNIEEDYPWAENKSLDLIGLEVRYKIHKNNGTFRMGLPHDSYQPELFILAYDSNGNLKIVDIINKLIRGE